MNFGRAITLGFRKYANFGGISSRSEYWHWVLFVVVAGLIFNATAIALAAVLDPKSIGYWGSQLGINLPIVISGAFSGWGAWWSLAIALPTLAAGARRLRDAGIEPKRIWLVLFPFGVFVLATVLTFLLFPLAIILAFATLATFLVVAILLPIWLCKPSLSAEQGNRFLQ